jgi:hypothetical protein
VATSIGGLRKMSKFLKRLNLLLNNKREEVKPASAEIVKKRIWKDLN